MVVINKRLQEITKILNYLNISLVHLENIIESQLTIDSLNDCIITPKKQKTK